MIERPNILVLCGKNKRRSRTAEYIFKNDQRINIRSAGLSPRSDRQIKPKDLEWADYVFVMEDNHKARLKSTFRQISSGPIEVLHIEDDYEYLDENLIEILIDRINSSLKINFSI